MTTWVHTPTWRNLSASLVSLARGMDVILGQKFADLIQIGGLRLTQLPAVTPSNWGKVGALRGLEKDRS